MRSRLTIQGCVSVAAVVLSAALVCFVLGFAFQFGVLMARQRVNISRPSPTSTAAPTAVVPSPTAPPSPTATPEPSPTPPPTVTPTPSVTPTPERVVYTVQPGDTLAGIAARFGVTVEAILEANPQITNPDLIQVGQEIIIPTGQ